ncbi:MAG TPA: NAD-dependent epimerase/dehydratase family protein [Oligoflexia bacterium]|nr:NAD-dependent epimerase/dehydratase family protein [Oligoflexia bacterium]HMP48152.1 NAD-dependent epimerase/dehydratase family protein [Oligoflexia bacterium]
MFSKSALGVIIYVTIQISPSYIKATYQYFIESIMTISLPSNSTVLVTGATGFTGTCLVKKLCRDGHSVRAIARKSSNISPLAGLPVQWFRGDIYDPLVVSEAVKGVNYIFHVAALFRSAKDGDEEYSLVHVESSRLLAEAALKEQNFKRFIHVSTMGVHGHIESPPGNEESPYAPGDIYQRTKLEAELLIREFGKTRGLPFTVIRPTGIYGPGDMRLLKIFKMATWPIFPILGFGKCLYHLVHVEDLTDAMILAATHERALGDYFLVGAESAIGLPYMVRIIGSQLKIKSRIIRIPVTPFFILADILEFICKPFGIEPPIYRRRVAFYTKDRSFDVSKIKEKLGFSAKYSNEAGIRDTAKWYRSEGFI